MKIWIALLFVLTCAASILTQARQAASITESGNARLSAGSHPSRGEADLAWQIIERSQINLKPSRKMSLFLPSTRALGRRDSALRAVLLGRPSEMRRWVRNHTAKGWLQSRRGSVIRALSGQELNVATTKKRTWLGDAEIIAGPYRQGSFKVYLLDEPLFWAD